MTSGVTFHSSEQQLTKLLGGVESGAIQLPDFQRDWVWDDEHVRGLLASVSMSYPIGTLMLLDAGNEDVRFACRPVEGTMNANGTPGQLILDGQQRLTTLYQVLQSSRPGPYSGTAGRSRSSAGTTSISRRRSTPPSIGKTRSSP